MFRRVVYYILQLKAYFIFGRRVYAHGDFRVGDRRNISVGKDCSINSGAFILGRCRIVMGDRVTLSANSMLIDSGLNISVGDRSHIDGFIRIEDDVWVGAGAIVLPNVVLGRGCVVGAGSVVTKDVPEGCVVVGNPARIIRRAISEGSEAASEAR